MADSRMYKQGVATLGFPKGPSVVLRLNPNAISWNFQINTGVTETVGGRVVQVLGATLSDLALQGSFGESRGRTHVESRLYAEAFLAKMKEMAAWQARDVNKAGTVMQQPAVFAFPTKGWRFQVYIKDLTDPDGGGSVTHRPGKFAYDYQLVLSVQDDISDTAHILGKSNGVLKTIKDRAVQAYIDRIAEGIGWSFSQYNGHSTAEIIKVTSDGHGAHTFGSKAAER